MPAACDRYAAPDGSERHRTVQALADALRPGETGCLRDGTYDAVRFGHGGETDAPITLRSAPGGRARIRGSVWVPPGSDHVTIAGLAIEGTGEQNAVKVYAAHVRLEGNDLTNRSRAHSCLILGSDEEGPAEDVVVRGNYLHDCGSPDNGNKDHGIYAARVRGGEITGNLIVNPAAWAIQLYPDARGVRFARNVIDGGSAVRGGVVFGGDDEAVSRGNVVERNLIAFPATDAISSVWEDEVGRDNVARRNCLAAAPPLDVLEGVAAEGNVLAAARFADRDRRDYRLPEDDRCRELLGEDVAGALIARGLTPASD